MEIGDSRIFFRPLHRSVFIKYDRHTNRSQTYKQITDRHTDRHTGQFITCFNNRLADNQSRDLNNELGLVVYLVRSVAER